MLEWPIRHAWRACDLSGSVGSNPTLSAKTTEATAGNMSDLRPVKYWVVVVSKDHLEIGKKLGIVQANRGKAAPMKRMKPGDFIVFYSPKLHFEGKDPIQEVHRHCARQRGRGLSGGYG